jgi:putative spermidine/putrescine transport system permease protein
MTRERAKILLSFLPLLVLMAAAYVYPAFSNVQRSFLSDDGVFVGWKNYADVLSAYYFADTLLYTLKIALAATAISMVIAVALSLALRETFAGKKIALFLFQHNLCVPHMAVAMMMLMLLSQTGVLSSIAYQAGLTGGATDFPWLVRDSGGRGIVLTFVWKYSPYIGMSALGILQGASREYEQQAATLGVGRAGRFVHVVLPTILPATSVATMIVFAAAFGEYEIPALLGSSSHRAFSVMLYLKYLDFTLQDKPQAYVLMVVMTVVLMAFILGFWFLVNRRRARRL